MWLGLFGAISLRPLREDGLSALHSTISLSLGLRWSNLLRCFAFFNSILFNSYDGYLITCIICFSVERAIQLGSVSLQAEYMHSSMSD